MDTGGMNQKYLSLMWHLQTNGSNAVLTPWRIAWEMFPQKVYRAYDWNKYQYFYALEPLQDIPRGQKTDKGKGGRPCVLTDEQREQIREQHKNGVSKREIARRIRVSEGTVRNFLKYQNG